MCNQKLLIFEKFGSGALVRSYHANRRPKLIPLARPIVRKLALRPTTYKYAIGWLVGNRGGTFIQCIKAKYKCRPR